MNKLRHLDLFSGIGGFALGLERTGGFETVAFCEIAEFPREILRRHWPHVPIYRDVRSLTGSKLNADGITVDVITGGFPCQDISTAGKRAGMGAETRSGLWSEIVRLVGEIRPRYVLIENVSNLLAGPDREPGQWFRALLRDLAAVRYDAEWNSIRACRVGRPQARDRVWIMAYPQGKHVSEVVCPGSIRGQFGRAWTAQGHYEPCRETNQPELVGVADGVPDRSHRGQVLGNAVDPLIPELHGHAILEAERMAA